MVSRSIFDPDTGNESYVSRPFISGIGKKFIDKVCREVNFKMWSPDFEIFELYTFRLTTQYI